MNGIELHDDGTATVNGIQLRTPTLKEYADLIDANDTVARQARVLQEEVVQIRESSSETDNDDEIAKLTGQLRDWEIRFTLLRASVLVKAVELLGDPDEAKKFAAETPRWAADYQAFRRLLTHWETAPFPGSARPV